MKALIGGLGSGKTRTGAEAFVDLVLANPGREALMAGPTHEMTRDLCVPAFEAACPRDLIVRYIKSERIYELRGGRRVKHASADKPSSLEGRNLAGWWADEARYWPVESWRNLLARLRDARARLLQGIVSTTPAMGWLSEEFDTGRPGRTIYRISTRENAKNLAADYIANLERSYSPRLCRSLIEGDFAIISGAVFEEFDDALHVVDFEPQPGWRTLVGIDFGVTRPAVLFAQESPDLWTVLPGGLRVPPCSLVLYDELLPDNTPTDRLVPQIRARLQGKAPALIACDPAGEARDQATGMPSVHLVRAEFGEVVRYTTDPALRWVPNGIAKLQGALKPADGGPPRLYVARRLTQSTSPRSLVRSLRGYRYPEPKDGRPVSDQPVKDGLYDHQIDCARYLFLAAEIARGERAAPSRLQVARR